MTRDLINALTFNYSLLCRGRRCFDKKTIELMNESSKMITRKTPEVMAAAGDSMTTEDSDNIKEAEMITDHIDEISQFLLSLEIC